MNERDETSGVNNNFSGRAENVVQGQNIGDVYFQSGQQGVDSRFAGRWYEEIGSSLLGWELKLNGTFRAHVPRGQSDWDARKMRALARRWYGEWRICMDDPENPWIELAATDVESLALGVISAVTGRPEDKRSTLRRLDRSANIVDFSESAFTLSWTDNGGNRARSVWTRVRQ